MVLPHGAVLLTAQLTAFLETRNLKLETPYAAVPFTSSPAHFSSKVSVAA